MPSEKQRLTLNAYFKIHAYPVSLIDNLYLILSSCEITKKIVDELEKDVENKDASPCLIGSKERGKWWSLATLREHKVYFDSEINEVDRTATIDPAEFVAILKKYLSL